MEAYDTDHVSGLDAAGELVQADSLDLDAANQRTSSSGLGSLRELFASGGDDGLSTSKVNSSYLASPSFQCVEACVGLFWDPRIGPHFVFRSLRMSCANLSEP